jgi:hypothetical protein
MDGLSLSTTAVIVLLQLARNCANLVGPAKIRTVFRAAAARRLSQVFV